MNFIRKRPRRSALGLTSLVVTGVLLSGDNDFRRRVSATYQPLHSIHFNQTHGQRKKDLFETMRGDVLEIGAGTGSNFPYLPGFITYSATDRNPHVLGPLKQAAADHGFVPSTLTVKQRDLQGYLAELPSDSQNCVLGTLVLGTNDSHEQIAKEIHR